MQNLRMRYGPTHRWPSVAVSVTTEKPCIIASCIASTIMPSRGTLTRPLTSKAWPSAASPASRNVYAIIMTSLLHKSPAILADLLHIHPQLAAYASNKRRRPYALQDGVNLRIARAPISHQQDRCTRNLACRIGHSDAPLLRRGSRRRSRRVSLWLR